MRRTTQSNLNNVHRSKQTVEIGTFEGQTHPNGHGRNFLEKTPEIRVFAELNAGVGLAAERTTRSQRKYSHMFLIKENCSHRMLKFVAFVLLGEAAVQSNRSLVFLCLKGLSLTKGTCAE